jgi:hypothetical protein
LSVPNSNRTLLKQASYLDIQRMLTVKQSGREGKPTTHSSSTESKNVWAYLYIPPLCLHGVMVKHKDNFTLSFIGTSAHSLYFDGVYTY